MQSSIQISIAEQTLTFYPGDGTSPQNYPISTSKYGIGAEEGSFKTPLGSFRICEKHGDGEAINTIFQSRKPVGIYNSNEAIDADLVLTRILWLDGLDPECANTKSRYIYIHGTNQEELIGTPASIGCIRMRNADILTLFDQVPADCPVFITEQ